MSKEEKMGDFEKKILENKVLNRCKSIEIVSSEKCQNACKYCYRVKKHSKSPVYSLKGHHVKTLVDALLNQIEQDTSFTKVRDFELFGGDSLIDYADALDILRTINREYKPQRITIPTNARMLQELTINDIRRLVDMETPVGFSLSVDGISDGNRRLSKIGKMLAYNEEVNYPKLLKIAKEFGCGFHPMLSFTDFTNWLPTIKHFFENMGVIPYLLEVRHSLSHGQSLGAVKELVKVRKYLESKNLPKESLKNANTTSGSITPRGLGCSALTTLCIMPNGDIPFCHRLIDEPWLIGNVFHGIDISKAVQYTSTMDHRNFPDCIICPIRRFCNGLCVGACYEYWGDPWIPITTICDYMRLKYYIFGEVFEDWKNMLYNAGGRIKRDILLHHVSETFGGDNINKILEEVS